MDEIKFALKFPLVGVFVARALEQLSEGTAARAACAGGESRTVARLHLIKRLLFGVFVLCVISAKALAQDPLNSLQAIHKLSNSEADKGLPVAVEATVTYFSGSRKILICQDSGVGLYVKVTSGATFSPGDRVLIKGQTRGGYLPFVLSGDIRLVGHDALPKPVNAGYDQLIGQRYDSVLITTRGVVRSANLNAPPDAHLPGAILRVATGSGLIDVDLNNADAQALGNLLDAEVELTGVAGARFDGKFEQTGVILHVSTLSGIKVLKTASTSPWALPLTPIDHIMDVYRVRDLSSRVRVTGVVTYYVPGSAMVLQNGASSLWVRTASFLPVHVGDRVDATGFPNLNDGFPELASSEIQNRGSAAPVAPISTSWQDLTSRQHVFDLVSVEGQVMTEVRGRTQDEYVLVSDGNEFSAVYRHPVGTGPGNLAPMVQAEVGSRIRVTGICVQDYESSYGRAGHFTILLRAPDDIAIMNEPSWLNVIHLTLLAGLLLVVVVAVGMRGWYLENKIRRQIGSLAYVEQRRGRILEDINHSKPLAGILERITELVSVRLNGAPCWCQIANGAMLGNRPAQADSSSLRIVEHTIAARSGPPLGSIFAAFDARTKPAASEDEALAMASELATLAIETARLYTDLVHRSEFDLLTDVQNRFAMEKSLRAQIHSARQSASVFGLIYIDLNEFKQVNDVYGHQAGDLYLQELTQRMKAQLRPGDTLARLGGDEFAVLVSQVRNRSEVEEIAVRLECCFDEPFQGDGYRLHGSASIGIALYPDDANSADSLLRAADSAMYAVKGSRARNRRAPGVQPDANLSPRE